MKVLYVISVRGHGRGGHFHSLNHIASQMGKLDKIEIISVGTGKSVVLEKNPLFREHCYFDGYNLISFIIKLRRIVNNTNSSIIHCFDGNAFNIVTLAIGSSKKMVVNKCGGPNPIVFPIPRHLILFSEENEIWFKNNKDFKNTCIYRIPNRVNKEELKFDENGDIKKPETFNFLRIARIGNTYYESISNSIDLIKKLSQEGVLGIHLFIIGTIEDENVLSKLKNQSKDLPISFITNTKYTSKASNMLYLADAVIATGRGIMEATALGKPILTPAKNSKYPILVNKFNFNSFLATNFSQRNMASTKDIEANFESIINLIKDEDNLVKAKTESFTFFSDYFDISIGIKKYQNVYDKIIAEPQIKLPRFRNLTLQLKTIYFFIRNAR